MSSFTIPRAFRRNRESKKGNPETYFVPAARTSKVQHLLGISGAELKQARSHSTSSASTVKLESVAFSEATTAPVSTELDDIKSQIIRLNSSSNLEPDSVLPKEDHRQETDATDLKHQPSSSTLQSYYDSGKAPLSVSQQTSDSSSRDFALRKGASSIISLDGQKMEHARQLGFFKSSKLRSKEGKKLSKQDLKHSSSLLYRSPAPSVKASSSWANDTQISLPSVALVADTPHAPVSGLNLFPVKKQSEAQNVYSPVTKAVDTTPYAKVNVRRPRAGAKHWFDSLEGDTSDDESISELESKQTSFSDVQHTFGNDEVSSGTISSVSDHNAIVPSQCLNLRAAEEPVKPSRVICPAGSTPLELPACTNFPTRPTVTRSISKQGLPRTQDKLNPLATANLNQQSVLCLSSDDEDNTETSRSSKPVGSSPAIRDSISFDNFEDSEVEIGLARTVKTQPGEPVFRASQSQAGMVRTQSCASPTTTTSKISSRPASRLTKPNSAYELSEEDIITSFPATPSETTSRRTSIRTSTAFSDTASMKSSRLMLVTKQEEKLLAAMRSKRAVMGQVERDAERRDALKVLESGGRWPTAPNGKHRFYTEDQARLDHRLSSRYAPPRGHAHHPGSGGNTAANPRGSGTTFQTLTDASRRNSQATTMSSLSDEMQSPYSAYNPVGQGNLLLSSLRSPREIQRRRSTTRDTFLSMASDSSGYRRDSHIVMLDGLDETLERQPIPSQLFMENPFVGWDRITAAH